MNKNLSKHEHRQRWCHKIKQFDNLQNCTEHLRAFRSKNLGTWKLPSRELSNDALWIEAQIENKLAILKAIIYDNNSCIELCTTGEPVDKVVEQWMKQIADATTKNELEAIFAHYRCMYKPPIMPVNDWLKSEKRLQQTLMTARAEGYRDKKSIDVLRQERGAKVIQNSRNHTHTVKIIFEEDGQLTFECRPNEDVISAALRHHIILMAQCREGRCTTCKGNCMQGSYTISDKVNVYSLPPEESESGGILGCQTYPTSDITVKVPYPKSMTAYDETKNDKNYFGRVILVEQITETTIRFVLENINPNSQQSLQLPYTAGQYITVNAPGTNTWHRFYMTTPSRSDGHLTFIVSKQTQPTVVDFITTKISIGQNMLYKGPFGRFCIDRRRHHDRIFVFDESGFSPVLAMLNQMNHDDTTVTATIIMYGDPQFKKLWHKLYDPSNAQMEIKMHHISAQQPTEIQADKVDNFISDYANNAQREADIYISGQAPLRHLSQRICNHPAMRASQQWVADSAATEG